MLLLRRSLFLLCTALALAAAAGAAPIVAVATPFTGSDLRVRITLSQEGGDVRVDLAVEDGVGDLRGIFFHIADESLLDGLTATGDVVTAFATGGVTDLGQGNNVNGGGTPCPCEIGVSLGTPGMGKDDLQSASFLLSHESGSLSLAQFSEQWVGVRVTSVGDGKRREGSAKLSGTLTAVPEPSTALLLLVGLAGMARARRR